MEISKSTPYVRYRENISSTLHKGTIHIESEYLDRERKTTIESIEGQTWQNMVNGENKEEEILPRLGLKIEGNEDMLDSVEQHMSIDTIIGDVEPVANDDGTYTYEISTMEGSYAKTLDGENNFSLTSDGLIGDMYIKYNAQGEEVNGNIVMNNQSSYTIENSNNGEIKSAILSGNTLVNICKPFEFDIQTTGSGLRHLKDNLDMFNITLDDNKKYSVWVEIDINEIGAFSISNTGAMASLVFDSITYLTLTGGSVVSYPCVKRKDSSNTNFSIGAMEGSTEGRLKGRIMVFEGDVRGLELSYFEGMQSVKLPVLKTTGKNLFDGEYENGGIHGETGNTYDSDELNRSINFIKVKPSTQYYLTKTTESRIYEYDKNKQYLQWQYGGSKTLSEKTEYIRISWVKTGSDNLIQLEEGLTATEYEPFKSNILTVNEDIELRGIGNVQDELDLETGVLTQRIGEITFDGSEKWSIHSTSDNTVRYHLSAVASSNKPANSITGLCNRFLYGDIYAKDIEGIQFTKDNGHCYIRSTIRNLDEFKSNLANNPVIVQYLLATESIKIVDLTIKDQDNKIIQSLHTHPSTTHINLSSDGLIPDAELSYTMYGNIGETTGEKITDGTDSKLIEGKVYGDTLLNVLPSPSLKNSMDYNTSMQKLNNGYDNINVVDGEFKKATLYGQTLVNLIVDKSDYENKSGDININIIGNTVKSNTNYTLLFDIDGDTSSTFVYGFLKGGQWLNNKSTNVGKSKVLINTDNTTIDDTIKLRLRTNENNIVHRLVLIEGDYTNQDIPYFEGMQSVVMPSLMTCGKNLFHSDIQVFNNSNYIRTGNDINNVCDTELKPSTTYALSWNGNNRDGKIRLYSNGIKTNSIDIGWYKSSVTFTTSEVENGFSFYTQLSEDSSLTSDMSFNVQLEEGTTTTSYEPYQSNILTVNEPIELRGIGDVRDELDCVTGKVIERIGEIVLDGSESWRLDQDGSNYYKYALNIDNDSTITPKANDFTHQISNLLPSSYNGSPDTVGKNSFCVVGSGTTSIFVIYFDKTNGYGKDFIKQWLSENPITIQYELATPTVKTIDLSITNQDNQPQTALHSIANGYINVTSQGLLPKVDYEIPTSNSYYLDMVKPNTQYTTKSSSDCNATIDGVVYPLSANGTFTTPSTITDKLMVLDAQVDDLMFIEGDLTDRELPYFEGIESVENPLVTVCNKNLLNPELLMVGSNFNGTDKRDNYRHSIFIPIEPNKKYCFRYIDFICWFDIAKKQIGDSQQGWGADYRIYTSPSNAKYVRVIINNANFPNEHKNKPSWFLCSIIKSNVNIYESYCRTDLKTIPQISLHKIGDVKDELDLVNECVVRRIGEVVLDGSENWRPTGTTYGKEYAVNIKMSELIPNAITPTDSTIHLICDKLKHIGQSIHIVGELTGYACSYHNNGNFYIRMPASSVDEVKAWLANNKPTLYCKLETPTTEPVRIVPQNPKQSTVLLTLQSPLQKVGNVADQLRWNPYKGHYVRYNYIQDGVANSTYTFEDLKDMNERKFVNLYNQRTYIETDHTVQVISHGLSRYCLAEQGKQYQVRWDWVEQPSVDTIKVDLCGNVKEIPSSDNSVVIDVEKFTHQFIQIQGLGLTGKITNLMVIETIDGEIPDVDFFSGIQCVGNTVTIDGNTKVQIDMEQTNGNLIDIIPKIYNNGNNLQFNNISVKHNRQYHISNEPDSRGMDNFGVHFLKEVNGSTQSNITIYGSGVFDVPFGCKYITIYRQTSEKGNANIYHKIDLHYADMAKDGIRPRYCDKESIILPMKLCRVGNIYDNLYYDDLKGYYRIQQSIGHKYFTGETTEVWTMETTNGYRTIKFTCTSANIDQIALGQTICNSFRHLSTINEDIEGFIIYNGNFVLRVDKDRLTDKTVDGFKALLASSPIHLFYQLKTPQMINLTEYPNRIELNTYRDEIFTFFKGMNPTKFTLSVPIDKTYRYEIAEEGQGLANRVTVNNETISAENVVAVKEVRGQGIANIIEDVNNVVITPRPNHGAVATSHTLNNTKPATIRVHGFEASGDTAIGTYNVTDKAYQLKVMSSNGDNSLSDYYVLNVPYKLETYADGTKDMVYYDEAYKQWIFKGLSVKQYTAASDGMLNETVEVFRGLAPRSGMIVEFKLRFTSGTTTARFSYSTNGVTYNSLSLRGMSDGNYLYVAFFNTGGTKIDMARKTDPNAEYELLSFLPQVPECLMVNQIQNCEFCEVTINKQYIYSEMKSPIELDTYDGTTKVFMDGNATDTNIIIRNDATTKIVNTYTDTEYTVYWKYVDGLGNLRITLGGTTVEVDGKQEYATIKTQLNAPQELLYVGGYNLSIKDLMVVKGAKIDDLPYFENSREVGTLVLDEEGNKSYKITLVQGGSVLEQRDEDAIAFKDDNKHNVVVHKIVGICPTKVD